MVDIILSQVERRHVCTNLSVPPPAPGAARPSFPPFSRFPLSLSRSSSLLFFGGRAPFYAVEASLLKLPCTMLMSTIDNKLYMFKGMVFFVKQCLIGTIYLNSEVLGLWWSFL